MDVSVQLYAPVAFQLNTSGTLWIVGWVEDKSLQGILEIRKIFPLLGTPEFLVRPA
jgi:hypothetical protein